MGLVAKMAVDKSLDSGLNDAREAFMNVVVDVLSAYQTTQNALPNMALIASPLLKMLPLYVHGILRSPGFRSDLQVRLDDRVHFMNQMKTLPLSTLIQSIYPDLYPIHNVANTPLALDCDEEVPDFPLIHLCSSRIEAQGVYVMDKPELIIVYVCRSISKEFCQQVLNVDNYANFNELSELPELDNPLSLRIRNFINNLQLLKPHFVPVRIFREDSRERMMFVRNLVEDRGDSSSSYYEFLQQLKTMVH
jgi:protein transport protein SEC24